jgi:hypothetical protein
MGVNLEASDELLPTTRLILGLKRRGRRQADLTGHTTIPRPGQAGVIHSARGLLRVLAWMAEEWYRAALAWRAGRGGRVVIFDRHFFCDYYASDIRTSGDRRHDPPRTLAARLHGAMLRRWYPRPDLTILLDAPAEVLVARKPGASVESAEIRRRDYLELGSVLPRFAVVDADRSFDLVVEAVSDRVVTFVREWSQGAAAGPTATIPSSDPAGPSPGGEGAPPDDAVAVAAR